MAMAKSRFITVLALAFALVTLVVRWAKIFVPSAGLATLDTLLLLVFLGMLAVIVLFQVFREGPITIQRISGAVVVYLLLGLMWALAYQLIELQQPGSFNFADAPAIGDTLSARLVYFSFVTLTTLGYGDITAVSPVARTLAMLEAVIGQLFPAILIARLVSMELYYRRLM
jgi:voltage-gated potassium channel Kch